MVSEGRCRLFRRKDGKYLLYVPLDLAQDSMFPFPIKPDGEQSIPLWVSFEHGKKQLIVEEMPKKD